MTLNHRLVILDSCFGRWNRALLSIGYCLELIFSGCLLFFVMDCSYVMCESLMFITFFVASTGQGNCLVLFGRWAFGFELKSGTLRLLNVPPSLRIHAIPYF